MKYFYDTEFHDNGSTIDLISIGIVAEDGREYYAINASAKWASIHENEWLTENVVNQLPEPSDPRWRMHFQIRDDVAAFLTHDDHPELWAWFAAYDHVVLSQLFGRMLDLPQGIPMYTHDLRAFIDYLPRGTMPVQASGQHDALEDARWVRDAHAHVTKPL